MKKIILSIVLVLITTTFFAQVPANNTCATAQNIGTLGAPGPCGAGIVYGATSSIASTNVNATAENPYIFTSCTPNFGLSVWYQFTVPTNGFGVVITLSNGGTLSTDLANPEIAVFQGSCAGLASVACLNGASGTGTLNISNGLVVGQTYYIRIAGADLTQQHTFNLDVKAYHDCADCLNAAHLTINPLPINGTYQPGQTVSFCYHIDQYTQTSGNWLHGVQLAFGNGWDLATLTTTAPSPLLSTAAAYAPSPCTGTSCGNWAYYPAGIASLASGLPYPAGFYFNGTYSSVNSGNGNGSGCTFCRSSADGNPGNNFGDGIASVTTVTPAASDWNFCFTIQVLAGCNPGGALTVTVGTTGDGESGGWSNSGCASDAPASLSAITACCPPTVGTTSAVACNSYSNAVITATSVIGVAGSQAPYIFAWTGPSGAIATNTILAGTTNSIGGLGAGVYTVVVTDQNQCSQATTYTVTQPAVVPVTASVTNSVICSGNSTTLSGGGASTYTWTNGVSNAVAFSPTTTATYTVTGTSVSGCTNTAVKSVTVNSLPITVASTNGTLTCATTTVALNSTLAGMNYTWTAPSGASVGSANTQSTTASGTAGTYTVKVVNAATGCTYTTTTAVTQNTTAPTTVASTTGTLTCSNTTVALNSTLAGMNYTWTAPSGASVGSANTQSTTASGTAGTYTIKVVNPANGCTYTTTAAVTQNTTVPVTVASTTGTLTCTTLTVALNSTLAGMNYTWTAPAGGSVGTPNTQSTNGSGIIGTYSIHVVNPVNGCSYSTTTSVTQNTATPTVTMPSTKTITCASPSVTLIGSANPSTCTAVWTGGVCGGATTYSAIACSPNTYTLTVTNPLNGCVNSGTVDVVPSIGIPSVIASNSGSITCAVLTTTVSATTTMTPVSYSWTGPSAVAGSTTANGIVGAGGTYQCVVINTLTGCASTVTTFVPTNTTVPVTVASVTGTLTCLTSSIALSSSLGSMNYTWTAPSGGTVGSANTQATSGTGVGIYSLTVIDPINSCTYSTTATASQNTVAPSGVSAGTNQTLTCGSTSVTLTGSLIAPITATVNWTGASVCGTATSAITSACSAGVYTITATDPSNGCVASSTMQVFPNAGAPTVSISSTALVINCNAPSQSVTVTSTPSTDVTYSWNVAPTSVSAGGSVATFANANTYICTVTNTLSNCASVAQVVITTNTTVPTIVISPTQTLTCSSPSVTIGTTVTPIGSSFTYTWSGGALVSGQSTGTVVVNTANTYVVNLTDAVNGCTNTATSIVTSNAALPVATILATSSNSVINCLTSSVTLSVSVVPTATYNYTWSTGSNNSSITAAVSGTYSVLVSNTLTGCSTTAQYTVVGNNNIPNLTSTALVSIPCGAASTSLSANSTNTNVSYSWAGSATSIITGSATATPNVNMPGTYIVTVTDLATGCTNSNTVTVTQINITAAFTADPTSGVTPLSVNFTNQSTGAISYSWFFGNGSTSTGTNPSTTYNINGTYTVTLIANAGSCTASASAIIVVQDGLTLEIPNVFTPNGDGINDVFTILSTGVKEISLSIFNRWGLKLYEFTGTSAAWDGNVGSGAKATDGTYFFFVKATGFDDTIIQKNGTVNLFK